MVEADKNQEQNKDLAAPGDQVASPKPEKIGTKKAAKKKVAKKKTAKKKTAKKSAKKTAKKKTAKKKATSRKKTIKKSVVQSGIPSETVRSVSESPEKGPLTTQPTEQSVASEANPAAEKGSKIELSGAQSDKHRIETSMVAAVQRDVPPEMASVESSDIAAAVTELEEASAKKQIAKASSHVGKTESAELIIKAQLKKEDEPMASTSQGSSSLWPKVIFWLIIIIIGFAYIRSLAKHPGTDTDTETETSPAAQEESSVVSTTPEPAVKETEADQSSVAKMPGAAPESAAATAPETPDTGSAESAIEQQAEVSAQDSTETTGVSVAPPDVSTDTPVPEAAVPESAATEAVVEKPVVTESPLPPETTEPITTQSVEVAPTGVAETMPDTSAAPVESAAPAESMPTAVETPQAIPGAEPSVSSSSEPQETKIEESSKPESAPPVSQQSQPGSDTATRILSEFDEMRKAAEAERKAMYEMMRKQREMREPMMPGQTYPRWQNPGYPSYNPYPQGYYPYGYPQQ